MAEEGCFLPQLFLKALLAVLDCVTLQGLCGFPPPVISAYWRTSPRYLCVNLYWTENTLRKGQLHEKNSAPFIYLYMSVKWALKAFFVFFIFIFLTSFLYKLF